MNTKIDAFNTLQVVVFVYCHMKQVVLNTLIKLQHIQEFFVTHFFATETFLGVQETRTPPIEENFLQVVNQSYFFGCFTRAIWQNSVTEGKSYVVLGQTFSNVSERLLIIHFIQCPCGTKVAFKMPCSFYSSFYHTQVQ